MFRSLFSLCALFALNCLYLLAAAAVLPNSMHTTRETDDILTKIRRDGIEKRSLPNDHIYTRELACRIDMVGIEGEYYYTEMGLGLVCGTYFLAEPEEIIEVEIIEFSATCGDGQLEFFDGWATSAGLYPMEVDHQLSMDQRVQSVCPWHNRRHTFRSSQNVAMISFKLPEIGNTLRISYKSKRIPNPCHVMAKEPSGMYTMRNHGQEGNCSFANIYQSKVTIVQMQIGAGTNEAQLKCNDESDFLELITGNALDLPAMTTVESMCGRAGNPLPPSDNSVGSDLSPLDTVCATGSFTVPLPCAVALVRMTSSGLHENMVHFMYNQMVGAKNECLV